MASFYEVCLARHSPMYYISTGHARRPSVSVLSVLSTVIWLTWAAAGLAGLRFTNGHPAHLRRSETPITVERMNVNVVKSEPRSSPNVAAEPRAQLPLPQLPQSIPLPALAPVADPRLDVPFPVAVKGPSKVVESSQAAPIQLQQSVSKAASGPPVDHLTFGEGEGDQPAPEYPREAKLAHEEGTVVVQMTIGENGDITDAKVTSASPWPILNQAALRAVRDTWHFGKGPVRYKDIEFDFELRQR
jgi:protein TonB